MGMDDACWPRETPPTNTTASSPSRRTVINGRIIKAQRPARICLMPSSLMLPSSLPCAMPFCSNACVILIRHLIFLPSSLSIVTPITRIKSDATREKMPSQRASDFAQRSEACVNQMAMKVPPSASAMSKPIAEPIIICQSSTLGTYDTVL